MNELEQHYYDKMISKINEVNRLKLKQELIDILDQLVGELLENRK